MARPVLHRAAHARRRVEIHRDPAAGDAAAAITVEPLDLVAQRREPGLQGGVVVAVRVLVDVVGRIDGVEGIAGRMGGVDIVIGLEVVGVSTGPALPVARDHAGERIVHHLIRRAVGSHHLADRLLGEYWFDAGAGALHRRYVSGGGEPDAVAEAEAGSHAEGDGTHPWCCLGSHIELRLCGIPDPRASRPAPAAPARPAPLRTGSHGGDGAAMPGGGGSRGPRRPPLPKTAASGRTPPGGPARGSARSRTPVAAPAGDAWRR